MSHAIRWTVEKITQRLALVEPLVYRRKVELPNFHFHPSSPKLGEPQPNLRKVAASPDGVEILPNTYWGGPEQDFTLRTTFQVPADWDTDQPIALYLPLGEAGSFSHPEALFYIDGKSFAACDRHHQEVQLDPRYADGQPHELVLRGWTGTYDWDGNRLTRLVMRPCFVAQIDSPTREFTIRARVALATARILDDCDPVRVSLLNALDNAFKLLDTREPFGGEFYSSVIPALFDVKQRDCCSRAATGCDHDRHRPRSH